MILFPLFLCVALLRIVVASASRSASSIVELRRPPNSSSSQAPVEADGITKCETSRLCVGPRHDHYPIGHAPGVLFTSRFVVPPLPEVYNSETMTYYDYYNIFFRQQPKGGYMDQFVPQLLLGNVLANSTNYPNYDPIWEVLDTWHIGAQYFFALPCNNKTTRDVDSSSLSDSDDVINKDKPCWHAKAATGKLVPVVPGEVIETSFELVQVSDVTDWEWHLRMGVVGAHPNRWSLVVARTPFMGLVPNTKWQDDIYRNVTVGSCLENYGMTIAANFPKTWEIVMDVITTDAKNTDHSGGSSSGLGELRDNDIPVEWDDWIEGGGQKCSWLPQSTVRNVQGSTWQRATWNATLRDKERTAEIKA